MSLCYILYELFQITRNGIALNYINLTGEQAETNRPFNLETLVKQHLNQTIVYDIHQKSVNYMKLISLGEYFQKSPSTVTYEMTFKLKTKLLVAMYEDDVIKLNMIAFLSTVAIKGSTNM